MKQQNTINKFNANSLQRSIRGTCWCFSWSRNFMSFIGHKVSLQNFIRTRHCTFFSASWIEFISLHYIFKMSFNIIFNFTSRSPKLSIQVFRLKCSHLRHEYQISSSSQCHLLHLEIMFGEEYKSWFSLSNYLNIWKPIQWEKVVHMLN